jgi:hypothetical protein
MRTTIFKNVIAKPSPITVVASNDASILIFRRNRTLELIDSYTLASFLTREFEYDVACCKFLTANRAVCGTECGKLILLNIRTLERECIDVEHSVCGIATSGCLYAQEAAFYYCNTRNEVHERRKGESVLLYRSNSRVLSLLLSKKGLVTGDENGRIRVIEEGRITCELSLGAAAINMLCHVIGNKYAAACGDGTFTYFDVEMGVVLQTATVREHALRVCAFVDGYLSLSGLDSRIIAYRRTGDRFIRAYQIDTHYSEVTDIAVDNGRILTVGEDTIVSVVWPRNDRYMQNKIYPATAELRVSGKTFSVNNRNSIDLYVLEEEQRKQRSEAGAVNQMDELNEEISFKLSNSFKNDMGYRTMGYRYWLKLFKGGFICSSVLSDRYIGYSTAQGTEIHDLTRKMEPLNVELEPAKGMLLKGDTLLLQTYNYEVLAVDLTTCTVSSRVPYEDYREEVFLMKDAVVLSHSKRIVEDGRIGELRVEGEIVGACDLYVLTLVKSYECKRTYHVYRASFTECERIRTIETFSLITSIFSHDGRLGYLTPSSIHLFDDKWRESKNPLGALIYGCGIGDCGVVALQDSWSSVRLGLKPSVFKPKYSTK